jgi:hypothetical protein
LHHSRRKFFKHCDRCFPAKEPVCDALPIGERLTGRNVLTSAHQMAFDHDAHDGVVACGNLMVDTRRDLRLFVGVLGAADIDGHRFGRTGIARRITGGVYTSPVIVGLYSAA